MSGQAVYQDRCAACHGPDGQGGVGARLANGRVVARFPRHQDEQAVVENGSGTMPAFRTVLTPEEVQAVVAYTRQL